MGRIKILYLTIIVFIISNCSPVFSPSASPPSLTSNPTDRLISEKISGRVVDLDGVPIPGADVITETAQSQSDNQGWFYLSSSGYPQWVTIKKSGYISRTRAAEPGTPILIRISPDDGKTIVFNFAGDVMLGRRFFDPNEDGDPSDGLLPVNPSVEDHLKLLEPIKPLLENSDITAVNLESAIDSQPYFSPRDPRPIVYHPTKDYVYATHLNAITALMQSGVNVVGIGNNHVYDMLELGMANTISYLDNAGMMHFGAGMNEAEAWTPVIITIKGQKIAFIGCTTIFGNDRIIQKNEISYVASDLQKKGGAALCDKNKIRSAVIQAKQNADIIIVMVHGGVEYDRLPSGGSMRLTKIAEQAGATMVINHHPHVVSGFSFEKGVLTGWSLGNFISDQTVWPSFESYLVTVYVRDNKIIRAFVEPVMLKNYVAWGVTSDLSDYVARGAAGRKPGPFIVESGEMEVDVNNTASQISNMVTLNGGQEGKIIPLKNGQWISAFKGTGNLQIGRDLLWVGGFENSVVGNNSYTLPLWNQTDSSSLEVGKEFAYEGSTGIRLLRGSSNGKDAVTSNLHRIFVKPGSNISISGMYRGNNGANISVQVSLYPDTVGPSSKKIIIPIIVKESGAWQSFKKDIQIPADIVATQVYLRLSPPASGTSTADFDNIRVIEWAPTNSPFSILYNYAYLIGTGDLTFSQATFPGGESWLTLPMPEKVFPE